MRLLKQLLKILLAVPFLTSGMLHILQPAPFLRIMPPYLPHPQLLVLVSGVCEVILGLLLWIPPVSWLAAWGLIALLIAVFPANIHMAVHHALYPEFKVWVLWARLPVQLALIAWAWMYTKRRRRRAIDRGYRT